MHQTFLFSAAASSPTQGGPAQPIRKTNATKATKQNGTALADTVARHTLFTSFSQDILLDSFQDIAFEILAMSFLLCGLPCQIGCDT